MSTIVTETRVCDRCGSKNFDNAYGVLLGWSTAGKTWQGDWGGQSFGKQDLCGRCLESFQDWFNTYKEDTAQ